MKFFLPLIASLILGFSAYSQVSTTKTIKGAVLDSLKKQPLSYVTVTLKDSLKSSQSIKSVLTKDNGTFEIVCPGNKTYLLIVASVGYKSKYINVGLTENNFSNILLAASSNQLNEVEVVGTKPIVSQEVDRISYDVQSDPESKAITVLDMLKKVPLVSVDGTDNIKLKGTGNFKILINGKESALIAKNPSDVFKGMPASNIQKIEVITTPPAKYDAEGLSGIINIITKKNMDQGYNGNVSTRLNSVYGPGVNINATLKQGKIGFGGYFGLNNQMKQTTGFSNSNNIIKPVNTNLLQEGSNSRTGNHAYGSGELSYEIDTLNLITASFQNYDGRNNQSNNQYSSEYGGANQSLLQSFHLLNSQKSNYGGYDMGINYQLGFKNRKDQLLTTSYKYISSANNQDINGDYLENVNYNAADFKQIDESGSKEQTIQVDYVHPLKKFNIEAGSKAILRNNYSDFETARQTAAGVYVPVTDQSNKFDYRQNIFSVYNSYQLKLKKWVVKGGVRLEVTRVKANFVSSNVITNPDYNNLIPSFSIQRVINASNNLTFGYTDRIRRTGIWQLNPFVNKANPKFISVGNPDLQPVVQHSFELNYSNFKKGSVNVGLSYAYANNTVEYVLSVAADTVTTSTFQNVGKNKRLGLNLNSNYPLTSKLNVNVNAQLIHVWLSGAYNGHIFNNKGIQGYIFVDNSYKFGKGFNANFNFGFDSRYVMLQGKDNQYFYYSVSGSKDILKKKASVSLNINTPFQKYRNFDFYNRTSDFSQANTSQAMAREFTLSFNYKFGKLNSSLKKNQRGISNDDVGGGRN